MGPVLGIKMMKDYVLRCEKLSIKLIGLVKLRHYLEKKILERSNYILYPSEWSINSAINYYKVSRQKIFKAKFGPNLSKIPKLSDLKDVSYKQNILKLLFVAVKWNTKGGPIAIETLNE